MKKEKWKNYVKNNIEQVWWWANQEWVVELLDFPFIYTLKKFKFGKKLHKFYLKLRFFITKKPVMPIMEFMVTTRCTMNCRHCNSFMPKFKSENHINCATFEEFKNDIDTILKSVDFINFIGFVGGEATLGKDLAKMIEYACSKKQINQVFLATNATILPNSELINAMKNKKFAVQLSDYSHVKNIKNGVSVKFHEFKKILTENNIRRNSYQEKREATTWFTMPEIYKDYQDKEKMKKQYQTCVQTCNLICDGKILPCTATPYIYNNLELIPEIKEEVIDLRKPNIDKKELTNTIIEYFSRPNPAFCNYCHFDNIKSGLPCGEQI